MGNGILENSEGKGLRVMDPGKSPRYCLVCILLKILTCITCQFQDFHFQISEMAKIHSDHSACKELRSLLPHETFIMAPLLEGKWVKISGTDGSVRPDWRSDEDPEVVKLTRTLDAFQHFILQNSEEHQSSLIYKVYCIGENLAGSLMDVFRGISERRWTKLHEIS